MLRVKAEFNHKSRWTLWRRTKH